MGGKDNLAAQKNKYIGMTNVNNQGYTMTIVDYINYQDIVVEFNDDCKTQRHCQLSNFQKGCVPITLRKNQKSERLGEEKYNNNGELMKIVEYNHNGDIVVEFQDEYKYKAHTSYGSFVNGSVRNLFAKSVCGVGITGDKYLTRTNGAKNKEYDVWVKMLRRCFKNNDEKHPTYKNVMCCEEWLYYPNFYEWLHNQENFDKWYNGHRWCIDKDIIKKGNKIYSPDTCCLVPDDVNILFIKSDALRGDLPIGVSIHPLHKGKYYVQLSVSKNGKRKNIFVGLYRDVNEAFNAYKIAKEKYIKQVVEEEYAQGNITKACYDAMMNYQVEITD